MQKIDLPFFVELGAKLDTACLLDSEALVAEAFFKLFSLRNYLERLMAGGHVKLVSAKHNLDDLIGKMAELESEYFRQEDGKWRWPSDDQKDSYRVGSIVESARNLKTVLLAELRTAATFTVTGVGIFDVDMLVNRANEALDASTRIKISREVKEEIDAAGKCLAFNLPTACGFHCMRAIERVLKRYAIDYLEKIELAKIKNWGGYIEKLEKVSNSEERNRPSQEAMALLKQVKDIYRNPVIHADRTLNRAEASTLFHSTIAVVNRLASEFLETKGLGVGLANSTVSNALLMAAAAK